MLKLRRKPKKLALLLLVTAILVICTILILGNFFTAHALPFSTPNTITLPVGATGADLQATLDSILPGAANATTVIIQNDIITDQTLYLASQPPSHIPQYVILQGEHTITATMDAPAIRAVYATRFVLNGPTITRTNSGANSRGIVTHNMAFYFMAGEISGHSVDGHGAGVYGGGRVVMHGGSIINNTATGNGGGMHLYADVNSQWSFGVGTHHIYDGIIGNNNAYGNGGGISTYTLLIMEGGNIIGNVAHGDGGGFHTNRYDWMWIRIYGGSISYNTAHGNGGGAVLVGFDSWGPFIENDVTIHNNTAHGNGGGLWVTTAQREAGDIGSIHVQNVTSTLLYGNVAHGDGGGIWIDEQTTLVLNSFSNTLIKNNTAHGDGGGIWAMENCEHDGKSGAWPHQSVVFAPGGFDAIFLYGNSASNGGGIYVYNYFQNFHEGVIILNNSATYYGGGIAVSGTHGEIRLYNSTIEGNTARYGGGLAYRRNNFNNTYTLLVHHAFSVQYSTFANNTAVYGGAIWVSNNINTNNATINGNTATSNGGGIYITATGEVTLTNSHVTNNTAGRDGGGIFTERYYYTYEDVPLQYYDNISITNTNFSGNTSRETFSPPINYNDFTNFLGSLLNNDNINFRTGHLFDHVIGTITKNLITPQGTYIPSNMTFNFNVNFVSWHGVTPANEFWPAGVVAPSNFVVSIPVAGDGTTANSITTRTMTENIVLSYNWPGAGVFTFRISEQQNVFPHVLNSGDVEESMTFSQAQFYFNVYVVFCNDEEALVIRYTSVYVAVTCIDVSDVGQKVSSVTFRNVYTRSYPATGNYGSLHITKAVTGDGMGSRLRLFDFAITVFLDEIFFSPEDIASGIYFTALIVDADGNLVRDPSNPNYPTSAYWEFANGVPRAIRLAHGWSINFQSLPTGTQYLVIETVVEGYTPSFTIDGGTAVNSYTTGPDFRVTAPGNVPSGGGTQVDFENYFVMETPTGLTIGSASAIGLVVLAVVAFGAFVAVKAKKVRT